MSNQPASRASAVSHNEFLRRIFAQAERTSAPDFDPTCVLCEFGEEPGHEH